MSMSMAYPLEATMKSFRSISILSGIAAAVFGIATAPGASAQGFQNFLHGGVNAGIPGQFLNGINGYNGINGFNNFHNGFGNGPFSTASNVNNGSCHNGHNWNNSGWNNNNWNNNYSSWNNNQRRMIKDRIKQINRMARSGQISPQLAYQLDQQLRSELVRFNGGMYGGMNNYNYPYNGYNGGLVSNASLNFDPYSNPAFLNYLSSSNPALMTRFLSFLGM